MYFGPEQSSLVWAVSNMNYPIKPKQYPDTVNPDYNTVHTPQEQHQADDAYYERRETLCAHISTLPDNHPDWTTSYDALTQVERGIFDRESAVLQPLLPQLQQTLQEYHDEIEAEFHESSLLLVYNEYISSSDDDSDSYEYFREDSDSESESESDTDYFLDHLKIRW
uniref:Uncharacterized protein n=1 Tax=Marseillevirus LCMAC201 TaxID=2506605 RepID=A0A481YWV0_9VIRU|nr:MAG: hypothetical protein LCMAC201_02670 [Marseillevirus LCMAC201]